MLRYYAGSDVHEPEAVECEEHGWPHRDAKGRGQYENSHYDSLAEAWENVTRNAEARISLAARAVENARGSLARANEEAAEAVVWMARVQTARAAVECPCAGDDEGRGPHLPGCPWLDPDYEGET